MCVAIPARVLAIGSGPLPMADVDLAGRVVRCCVAYLPEAEVGDHVLIQNGFAVELLSAEAAAESLAAFESLEDDPGQAAGHLARVSPGAKGRHSGQARMGAG